MRQTWGERKEGMEREGEWWARGKSTQACLWKPQAGQESMGVKGDSTRDKDRDQLKD